MTRIEIRAEDFTRIARELKKAERTDLRKELYRGLNRSSKTARQSVLDSLPSYMPDSYASVLRADLKLSTSAKGGKSPEIRIRAKGKKKTRFLGPLDQGRLRHPLFGNRRFWYSQQNKPGFWTETLSLHSDEIKENLEQSMAEVLRQIAD